VNHHGKKNQELSALQSCEMPQKADQGEATLINLYHHQRSEFLLLIAN
jgi:hypothetical protein